MNNDFVYLSRRASEERSAAFKSTTREVAEIHRELADAYEFRVYLLKQVEALKGAQTPVFAAPGAEQTGSATTTCASAIGVQPTIAI